MTKSLDLKINQIKSNALRVNGKKVQKIKLSRGDIEDVKECSYYDIVFSTSEGTEDDIRARIGKAQTAFFLINNK